MTLWLVAGGLALVGWIGAYFLGRTDGAHAVRTEIYNRQMAAAERIADAQANAPTTRSELVDRLRNGGGL